MPATPFDDVITGNEFDNVLNGEDGLDVLSGLGGNDTLNGGADEDDLRGGTGDDLLNGGDGDDILRGEDGDDRLFGGNGDDRLVGGEGADLLDGGNGYDTASFIGSSEGIDVTFSGGLDLADAVSAAESDGDTLINIEKVLGSGHDDTIRGIGSGDSVFGRGGDDTFVANRGAEINGGSGYDRLVVEGRFSFTTDEGGGAVAENRVTGVEELVISGENAQASLTLAWFEQFERVVFDATATSSSALSVFVGDVAEFDVAELLSSIDIEGDPSDRPTVEVIGGDADQVFAGTAGAEIFEAGAGNDRVNAGAGDDVLDGDSGDDDLRGGDGNDVIEGDGGDDALRGGLGDDDLDGDSGNDHLLGGRGDDTLDGGSGDDLLDGGSGADAISGGTGFDTLTYENSGEGVEVHLSDSGFAGLGGDAEGDTVAEVESLIGSDFDDTIRGVGEGNVVDAGAGDDTIVTDGGPQQVIDGGAGTDRLIVTGSSDLRDSSLSGIEELEVTVNQSSSSFVELNLDQLLSDHIAFSDAGPLPLVQSQLMTQSGQDFSFVFEAPGATTATLSVFSNPDGSNGFDIDDSVEFFEIILEGTNLGRFAGNSLNGNIDVSIGVPDLNTSFSTGNITLAGPEFEALFADGSVTVEVIFSSAVDVFSGPDELFVSLVTDNDPAQLPGTSTVRLHAGTETVRNLSDLTLEGFDPDLHRLELIGDNDDERFTGTENNDFLVGNRGNDLLRGGAGDDMLIGGEDDDRLIGGAGADDLDGGAGFDTVSYVDSGEGITIDLTSDVAGIGGTAEGDRLAGFEAVLGSSQGDTITVGNGMSVTARSGDDTIILDGDDFGFGANSFSGGAGTDRLVVRSAANFAGDDISMIEELHLETSLQDQLVFTADQLLGFDRIVSDGSVVIGVALRDGESFDPAQLTIETDGSVEFFFAGFDGDDRLDLDGTAVDQAVGFGGDDMLLGNEAGNALSGGDGNDDLRGRGGDDALSGGNGDDTLRGDAGDDVLQGGDGDDRLIGGAGADALQGGDGFDTVSYIGSSEGVEVALDGSAAGIGGEAEGDTFSEVEGFLGSGFADVITGLSDDNVVNTRGGDDVIRLDNDVIAGAVIDGGTGTDTLLVGGSINDLRGSTIERVERLDIADGALVVIDVDQFNFDSVAIQGAATLGVDAGTTGVVDLSDVVFDGVIDGVTDLRLIGAGLDDALTGTEFGELMFGQGGNDALRGNDGDDRLFGGDGDDTLRGGRDNDTLTGEDGNDRLIGGRGDDEMTGGAGDDLFIFTTSEAGDDVITDFEQGEVIRINGLAGTDLTAFVADLQNQQAADPEGDVIIALQNGSITLADVGFGLEAAHFDFA